MEYKYRVIFWLLHNLDLKIVRPIIQWGGPLPLGLARKTSGPSFYLFHMVHWVASKLQLGGNFNNLKNNKITMILIFPLIFIRNQAFTLFLHGKPKQSLSYYLTVASGHLVTKI